MNRRVTDVKRNQTSTEDTQCWTMACKDVYKRKTKIAVEPLYHSGQLLVKNGNNGKYKSFFGELRGTTLFLYKHKNQENYTEKLNLEKLKSKDLPCPYMSVAPTLFTFIFNSTVVQLQMDNPTEGELWRGYLLTMTEKRISRKLMLSQSVFMMLEEALEQENIRSCPISATGVPQQPPRPPYQSNDYEYHHLHMPRCFLNVTRREAEKMLEVCPENGNLILRPSESQKENYAVTMRLSKLREPVIKHFAVTPKETGYVIELDPPKKVACIRDVVDYFCRETQYEAEPYGTPVYSKSIKPKTSTTAPKTSPKPKIASMQQQEPQFHRFNPIRCVDLSTDDEKKLRSRNDELADILRARNKNTDRTVTDENGYISCL
uniref:SH2 domain-containing protein n=1 Tax=Cynoglossus semilaevis TaxID=244447 RepID=A0A3P8VYQ2_CYNSE